MICMVPYMYHQPGRVVLRKCDCRSGSPQQERNLGAAVQVQRGQNHHSVHSLHGRGRRVGGQNSHHIGRAAAVRRSSFLAKTILLIDAQNPLLNRSKVNFQVKFLVKFATITLASDFPGYYRSETTKNYRKNLNIHFFVFKFKVSCSIP